MFKRAGISFNPHLRRAHQQASASTRNVRQNLRGKSRALIFASTALVGSVVLIGHSQIIHGDSAKTEFVAPKKSIYGPDSDAPGVLRALIWGSNKYKTLDPEYASQEIIRTPTQAKWLDNVALRDLAIQQSHAACVDARGDVYQWGEGFFGETSPRNPGPMPKLTLKGKDIVQLQLTEKKLYALSASGKVYVLATDAVAQVLPKDVSGGAWWGFRWLWGEQKIVDYTEVTPREPFGWRESFVSISAGKNHLLAITSKGRTYAHPINVQANHYGQLGFRHFEIPDPASGTTRNASNLHVELVPKSLVDPFSNSTRSVRVTSTPSNDNLANIDDKDIRFCPHLFEIPVLRGVDIAQVATGSRTSFARTKTGKVLGWGANEYGQIGLGSNVTLDTIIIPTEVILWRMVPAKTSSQCSNIAAGGDLTAFTVERANDSSPNTSDLLMCGNGQQGGLGNNSYSNVQGNPVSAKNVSGLLQYSDKMQSLQPIRPEDVSISPTGHVILALNSSSDSGGIGGRDVMAWGRNYDSELGNGKKSSLAMPTSLNRPDGERLMLMSVKANQVFDLNGKVWKRGVKVEQRVVAGYASTAVYWKVVS